MRFSWSTHMQMCLSLKTWTFIIRTGSDRSVELCHNCSISNDLTQMVNFPTWIPDCDSHSPALLDLFLSSDASICSIMAFPPLRNSNHVVVSVSMDFPSNSQRDVPSHCIAYDSSRADWNGLCDHLRDLPWEDIVKTGASAAASEFCEWVRPHSSGQPSFISIVFGFSCCCYSS